MQAIHLVDNMSVLGGTTVTAPDLCNSLAAAGVDAHLYTVARGPVDVSRFGFKYQEFPGTRLLPGLAISREMLGALQSAARSPIVVHGHCFWTMSTIYPSWAVRGTKSRAIVAPHGTLAPWAFRWRRWRKAAFWHAIQKRALHDCDCLHSTSSQETQDFRRLGLKKPIAQIPNPIALPEKPRTPRSGARLRRVLFLGRMHPIKGLDTLVRSWRQVQAQFPDWEVQLAGPPQYPGYREHLAKLAADLGCVRLSFRDEVPVSARYDLYDQADLFVLPSHSEGFGLVVAEALAHSLPAIVCKGAPWAGLVQHDCGWWVDHGEASIAEALRQALSMDDRQLRTMGTRGRAWIEREFSDKRVAQLMIETYQWMLGGGSPPEWVIQNP